RPGEHEDAGVVSFLADLLRRLDPVQQGHADVHQDDVRLERLRQLDRLPAIARAPGDANPRVAREDGLERLGEQAMVVGDENRDRQHGGTALEVPTDNLPCYGPFVKGDLARERIQKLLVTGDNRLKQGVDPEKARESWEQALAVAKEAGLEDAIRPLVEVRLADLPPR